MGSVVMDLIVAIVTIIISIGVMVFWFSHDSLTGMQLFKELWLYYAMLFVCMIYTRVGNK